MISRRRFVKASSGLALWASSASFVFGSKPTIGKVVVVFLEGGMDGLAAVPPVGDPRLKRVRPNLVPEKTIKLNSLFGLHPVLKNFNHLVSLQQAAVVHATSVQRQLG